MTKKIKITTIAQKSKHEPDPVQVEKKKSSTLNLNLLPKLNSKDNSIYVELFGTYIANGSKNFPEGREQFSLSSDMFDVILFGGITTNKSHDLWSLDPSNLKYLIIHIGAYEWKKIIPENQSANTRFGHTAIIHQKKLILFGGNVKLPNSGNYLQDLEIFNIEDKLWNFPVVYTKSTLKLRKYHIAELLGNEMFVHGGMDEDSEVLNDCAYYSITNQKWYTISISENTPKPALSNHTSCAVMPSEQILNPKFNLYKLPEIKIRRTDRVI